MSTQPSGPVNVLLVVDDDAIERLGIILRHLCVGMVDEPVRMSVLNWSVRLSDESIGPARVLRGPRCLWPWQRLDPQQVLDQLELEPPDIVHCFSPRLYERIRGWAARWQSAVAVYMTDLVDVRRLAASDLGGRVSAIAATPSVQRVFLELRPEMRDATHIVPAGVPAGPEAACLSRPDRVPACVATAPLSRESGIEHVLRSLQAIIRSGQEAQLFLLSPGPAERRFRQLVEQLGILQYVTFAVELRDWRMVEDAMRGADFYIMPSVRRRFTATRLTALACGLAIVAPRGTAEDYLIDGTTARLFDPDRPEQLTAAWGHLLEDRASARRLGESALDYARAHHQANIMATATAALYQSLAQRSHAVMRTT